MNHVQPTDHLNSSQDAETAIETLIPPENHAKRASEQDPQIARAISVVESFAAHRQLVFRIAYHILGRVADADDMVQELWLRWQRQDLERIQSARAWLGSAMRRLCIDQLRSARRQREEFYGVCVPAGLEIECEPEEDGSEDQEYTLTTACARMLETLRPIERTVFMLHEVFGYDYFTAAAMVGKDATNCRQILHRAKAHLRADAKARSPNEPAHRLAKQITVAARTGELTDLVALLNEDTALLAP